MRFSEDRSKGRQIILYKDHYIEEALRENMSLLTGVQSNAIKTII